VLYRYQDYISLQNPSFHPHTPAFHPNPTTGSVELGQTYAEVTVFDAAGKQLLTYNQVAVVDLSPFDKGVYFVQVRLPSGERLTQKVVKE